MSEPPTASLKETELLSCNFPHFISVTLSRWSLSEYTYTYRERERDREAIWL